MTAPTVALEKRTSESALTVADPPPWIVPAAPSLQEYDAKGDALISGVEGSAPVEVPG
jgi:hypothetical protein